MTGAATPMSPRGRRLRGWAAIALTAALPLGCLALSVVNALEAVATDEAADQQEASVVQLERRMRGTPSAASPAPAAVVEAIYLAGANPTLARADLQRLLVETAERSGGRVIEAQDDQRDDAPDLTAASRVRLRLTFDARNEALIDFLAAIETGVPLLTVERIDIRRLDAGADGDPENPVLRIGVVVAGEGRFASG